MPIARVAVAVQRGQPLEFRELEISTPVGNEVLVRTVSSGICHTDVLLRDSIFGPPLPAVPGHEGAGVIEAIGPEVRHLAVGDHVVLTQGSCGSCPTCRKAHPMNCRNYHRYNTTGKRANGEWTHRQVELNANFVGQSSFSSYILADANSVVVLPKDFPTALAAPLGCGLVTGASAVLNVMSPAPASSIIVIGSGAVGMAAIMAAKIKACSEIIVVDLHEARRQTALQIGATHAFDGADPELAYKIQMLTDGGADYAIDAVGITPTVQLTLAATKPGAHIILLGVNGIGTQIPMDLGSIAFNRKVEGAIMGDQVPSATIPQLAKFYLSGQFPFDKLVKYYSFKDINQAINDSESGAVIKPIVTFD